MKEDPFSYANLANANFLEGLYQQYVKDPKEVDPSWRGFFAGMEFSKGDFPKGGIDVNVLRLIEAYKRYGHKKNAFNPLQKETAFLEELELKRFFLSEKDLTRSVPTFGLFSEDTLPLSQLIQELEKKFCSGLGFEGECVSEDISRWTLEHLSKLSLSLSKEESLDLLEKLREAELFEVFLHTKYPGQTRFSLEGAETLIPMLHFLLEKGAALGIEELVLGMAHRGRLNVISNVLEKSYDTIFQEFEHKLSSEGSGDVKYHRGTTAQIDTHCGKKIAVMLAANPSHLESVDPIIEGIVRAKQEAHPVRTAEARKKVAAILIHGDASVTGQGVVYETLQMSQLEGYKTGGTFHIVVNNHIGYTTLPNESRSTLYCTDIAKTFGFPVFHVNAEKPAECIAAVWLAVQIRQTFELDVFIDLGCYRKYGHNEGDEPTFTQPLQYKAIKTKKNIRQLFEEELLVQGIITKEESEKKHAFFTNKLHETLQKVVDDLENKGPARTFSENLTKKVPALNVDNLQKLTKALCRVPENFHIHPKLQRLLKERLSMIDGPQDKPLIDWGMAEHLAFASLLVEGVGIRLSGQDVCRGTFSHRHGLFIDQETIGSYVPLNHLQENQAPCFLINSLLSEFAVMGFDLGYSYAVSGKKTGEGAFLVLWEAQFGDFVNGAQVIIDQYLVSADQKWGQKSNFTLLLPHGYEGKGPEHSSARMERFLQQAAENNLYIANCTTPSQLFHLLRRQAHLEEIEKKPLILFTPKLLLRHPACLSSLEAFASGVFQSCLSDPEEQVSLSAKTVLLCSGKVFYDLLEERKQRGIEKEFAILRIEQLYPFPKKEIIEKLSHYKHLQKIIWVQEESRNMGAWTYVRNAWIDQLPEYMVPEYAGRKESASPASGSYKVHKKQTKELLQQVYQR